MTLKETLEVQQRREIQSDFYCVQFFQKQIFPLAKIQTLLSC